MQYTMGDMYAMRSGSFKRGIYIGVFSVLGFIGVLALVGGVIINHYLSIL